MSDTGYKIQTVRQKRWWRACIDRPCSRELGKGRRKKCEMLKKSGMLVV